MELGRKTGNSEEPGEEDEEGKARGLVHRGRAHPALHIFNQHPEKFPWLS